MQSNPDSNYPSWETQNDEEKRLSPSSLSPLTSEDPIDFEDTIFIDKNFFFSNEHGTDFEENNCGQPFQFVPPPQMYAQPQVPQFVSPQPLVNASSEAFIPQPMVMMQQHMMGLNNNNNNNNSMATTTSSTSSTAEGCSSPYSTSSPSSGPDRDGPTLQEFVNSHLQEKPLDPPKKKKAPSEDLQVPELANDPSQPEKKKRGRKKRAKLEITNGDVSSVSLPREKLLVLSSNELDHLTEKFKSDRVLTPQETEELRRQRRLIKNRESAAQSRQRKKDLMEKLQQENDNLRRENMNLKTQVSQLQQENYNLRATQNFGLGKNYNTDQTQQSQASSNPAPKKTGITLLIFLFSFALLFMSPFQTKPAPTFPKVVREPMPDVTLNSLKASLNFPNEFPYERIPDMPSKSSEAFLIPERDEEEENDDDNVREEQSLDQRQKDKQFIEYLKRDPNLKSYYSQYQHSLKQQEQQQQQQQQQPKQQQPKQQNQYQQKQYQIYHQQEALPLSDQKTTHKPLLQPISKETLPPNDEFLRAHQSQDSELFYNSHTNNMDLEILPLSEEVLTKDDDCTFCQ